jgi:hypothetical protein
MKKNRINIIPYILTIILLVSVSCDDDALNFEPTDRISSSTTFETEETASLFLFDIYARMQDGNGTNSTFGSYGSFAEPWDNWSDNGLCGFGWGTSASDVFWGGKMNPSNVPALVEYDATTTNIPILWDGAYKNIRKCNLFIEGVTESTTLSDNYKTTTIAEARFLRAYFYHYLWMGYGGVPIITKSLNQLTDGDDIFYSRETAEATYNFLIKELDEISQLDILPETPIEGGRIVRGGALALKGWIELFNHDYAAAAATNKKIIDDGMFNLFPEYGALFLPENNGNSEGVVYRKYFPRIKGGTIEGVWAIPFTQDGNFVAYGAANPTQELVDDYCMSNGLPITDPLSGYDPQNPYAGREKRFYESIVYDGSAWYKDDAVYFRKGVGSPNEIDLENATGNNTRTGYGLRKRLDQNLNFQESGWEAQSWALDNKGIGQQDFYIFRFAEVLLNYAEAQNEASGPDATVIDAIDRIRMRAGIPSLAATFGSLSQDEMRTVIRRERRVELAFEDKRYWDLLRWELAEDKLKGFMHAMEIVQDGAGQLTYEVKPLESYGPRAFNAHNYLFPIPTIVIESNPELTQNPGYGN